MAPPLTEKLTLQFGAVLQVMTFPMCGTGVNPAGHGGLRMTTSSQSVPSLLTAAAHVDDMPSSTSFSEAVPLEHLEHPRLSGASARPSQGASDIYIYIYIYMGLSTLESDGQGWLSFFRFFRYDPDDKKNRNEEPWPRG